MNEFYLEDIQGVLVGKTTDNAINNGLFYGFSTRMGGVSAGDLTSLNLGVNRPDTRENIAKNYDIFCDTIGVNAKDVVVARQVHGVNIVKITSAETRGRILSTPLPDCDGLITNDKNVALAIFFADCTPVLLYDEAQKVLCLVHCGWRGTVNGFAGIGAEKMVKEYGSEYKNIHAVIGPCISKCCFEVGSEVKEEFEKAGLGDFVTPKGEKFLVDLKGANKRFLEKAGVKNITVASDCTMCRSDLYFSHRGCGESTGRMAVVAQIK